ncbi:MAG: ABC transporter ATP-binding protein [Phycisphaerae bacterium]
MSQNDPNRARKEAVNEPSVQGQPPTPPARMLSMGDGSGKTGVAMLTHLRRDAEIEADARPLDLRLYKRIFGYTRPYPRYLKILLVLVVCRALQLPLLELVFAKVINGPISHGGLSQLLLAVAGYLALAAFTNYVFYHRIHFALLLGEGVVHDLRGDIFERLQNFTMSFFHKMKLGRIISRITSDAEIVRQGIQDSVFITIVAAGQIVVALIIMAFYDRALWAVVLATTPFYYLTYQYFRSRLIRAWRANQESYSRLTATLAESVSGIRVTQGYVRQDLNAQLWNGLVVDHARYNMGSIKANGMFVPVIELLNACLVAALFLIGGYRILAGAGVAERPLPPRLAETQTAATTATTVPAAPTTTAPAMQSASHQANQTSVENLVLFYFIISNVLGPIGALGQMYTIAVSSMAGAERVFHLLDRQPDFVDDPTAVDLPRIAGRVEFRNLNFAYEPGKPVLHDISFQVEPGQTIALVGHTGSGKSSIINLISKFYLPTSGELLLDGVEIHQIKADSLHQQMGIVLQSNFLFTGSVADNIRLGKPGATEEDVKAAIIALDCLDIFEQMAHGIHTQVGERGAGLSLGERQLVCFARAMLADPRIILLDEATSSVDTLTEARLQKALLTLLKGRTSFVVAHRLSTIRHADVVLVLDHGRIVERGSHDLLLAEGGVYAELYLQFIQAGKA